MSKKIILAFNIFILTKLCMINACSSDNKKEKYFFKSENPNYDLFKNFNSFSELILEDCSPKYNTSSGFIVFNSNYPIIIDQTLNLNNMMSLWDQSYVIFMIYFKGIDINAVPNDYLIYELYILFSKLTFYNNNTLITQKNCNLETFTDETYSLFFNFASVLFGYVSYEQPLCPFVFMYSSLEYLYFTDISNSLINKNILTVIDVNDPLYNSINRLILDMAYCELTTSLMNKNLFSPLISLRVYGYLNDIEEGLFSDFADLENVDLQLDNFKSFFHKGNAWMAGLNSKIKVNLSNHNEVYKFFSSRMKVRFLYKHNKSVITQVYTYPDEDFCLFEHFPHDHLVVPIILPGKKIECSCTLLWLIQYYSFYFYMDNKNEYDANLNYFYANYDSDLVDKFHKINYCHTENFEGSISKCNFRQRLNICNKKSFVMETKKDSLYLDNDTDLLYLIKWLQFIILIIIQPVLSVLGIINSLISIYVINRKETKKYFTDKMYKHIAINCVFNVFFCSIMLLSLVNQCLFYNSAVFCSRINQYESTQYFTIVVIFYFGNSVKLCKNISFLAFTFSRYILSINKKKGVYDKFNKMNLRLYVLIILILSSLISLYKVFEYSVTPAFNLVLGTPFDKYSETECKINSNNYCYLFLAMKLINYFINDFLLYVINFLIDIKLVLDYNAYLIKKQKLLVSSTAIHHIENCHNNHNEEAKTKENKVTRMVVISNTLYLLTSLPEFICSLILNVFSSSLSHFSGYNFSTSLITNESEVFCLVSIVFNFYILVFFNQNFKKSFLLVIKISSDKQKSDLIER